MHRLNQTVDKTLQGVVKLISPDSMAFNEENNKQFTIKEFLQSEELKKRIQPGDIVLTKTSSNFYGVVRKLMDSEYDHVSVFLDSASVLHISPPRVRIIPSNIFLMRKMEPLIIRPQLKEGELEAFIAKLKSFENQRYDYKGLLQVFGLKTLHNIFKITSREGYLISNLDRAKSKKRKICTDLIVFSLAQSSEKFMNILRNHVSQLNFAFVGAFSPDDFKYLTENDQGAFQIIYPNQDDSSQLNLEKRKGNLERVKQTYDEWRGQVQIHTKDIEALPRSKSPQNMNYLQEYQQRIDFLIKQATRLVTIAQANKIFTKGYLSRVKTQIQKNDFFKHARFLFNLLELRRYIFGSKSILKNKIKFIMCLYQVYQSLSDLNILNLHFEKLYLPIIELILKKIATFFLQPIQPKL